MGLFRRIFGLAPKTDYAQLAAEGAVILDVRTNAEFNSGHIKGSLNIPVQNLQANLFKLKKDAIIITCCASGMRSASAKNILKSHGFSSVHNGGGWSSLKNKIERTNN